MRQRMELRWLHRMYQQAVGGHESNLRVRADELNEPTSQAGIETRRQKNPFRYRSSHRDMSEGPSLHPAYPGRRRKLRPSRRFAR